MSKVKGKQNFLGKNIKKNLLAQQNKLKEIYLSNDINTDNILQKIPNDYSQTNCDNIKHSLTELPQYSSYYLKRLEMTKGALMEGCKKKWPKISLCENILDLKGKVSTKLYNM